MNSLTDRIVENNGFGKNNDYTPSNTHRYACPLCQMNHKTLISSKNHLKKVHKFTPEGIKAAVFKKEYYFDDKKTKELEDRKSEADNLDENMDEDGFFYMNKKIATVEEKPKWSYRKFKCPLCDRCTNGKTELRRHILLIHKEKMDKKLEKKIIEFYVSKKNVCDYKKAEFIDKGRF